MSSHAIRLNGGTRDTLALALDVRTRPGAVRIYRPDATGTLAHVDTLAPFTRSPWKRAKRCAGRRGRGGRKRA